MFLPSHGTPYDLRFSIAGIPVTVSPFFWVTSMLLGFHWLSREPGGPVNLVAWGLCVFISILIHELGHALVMKMFGHDPYVVLHHFGGYATFGDRETPGRDWLISAAGPAAQFFLFTVLVISFGLWLDIPPLRLLHPQNILHLASGIPALLVEENLFDFDTPLYVIVHSMLWINLIWPLFNLLPIMPLDGGRLLAATLALLGLRRADTWAYRLGVVAGTAIAAFFLFNGLFLAGAMFAYFAMANYQALQGDRIEGI